MFKSTLRLPYTSLLLSINTDTENDITTASHGRSDCREAYIITCLSAMAHHAVLVGVAQVLTCCHEAVSLSGHMGW